MSQDRCTDLHLTALVQVQDGPPSWGSTDGENYGSCPMGQTWVSHWSQSNWYYDSLVLGHMLTRSDLSGGGPAPPAPKEQGRARRSLFQSSLKEGMSGKYSH